MNKLTLLFFTLALASISCLETTSTIKAQPEPTAIPTATQTEPASGAVFDVGIWTPKPETPLCAIVTAAKSLHLRNAPNEHAPIVGYLKAGERVTLDEHEGDWWKVATSKDKSGYSKADYLQIVTCP